MLALLSTGLYFGGLAYFKLAADGMPPLRGDRPHRLAAALLGSRLWATGAVVLGGGATVQVAALTGLTPVEAQPMFLAGLAVLLVFAVPILGERLGLREWGCVLLLAAATLLFARDASFGAPLGAATFRTRRGPRRPAPRASWRWCCPRCSRRR
ncbi:hypothetical protein BJF79_22685 [Actinomadura sp. CNU-125]|nr:hypothetical protein BJF79_22685 [Actinomadura sp. CNU-125]